jgi:hypothetical protein
MKRFYAVRALSGTAYAKAAAGYRDYAIEDVTSLVVNPTGKIALYLGHCPKGFWLEEFDTERLEAMRRLVTLEIELLEKKLPETHYPAFLTSTPVGLRDPLTDQPAKWDATRHIIFFERQKGCFTEGHWVSLAPVRDFNRCRS